MTIFLQIEEIVLQQSRQWIISTLLEQVVKLNNAAKAILSFKLVLLNEFSEIHK
jgi:hypothetical protein